MTSNGFTWWPKDWIQSDRVFELNLAERGLYRELIDRAMLNDNQVEYKPATFIRRFNSDPDEFQTIINRLVELELVIIDGSKLLVPECEQRLNKIRAGRKGGKKKAERQSSSSTRSSKPSSTKPSNPSTQQQQQQQQTTSNNNNKDNKIDPFSGISDDELKIKDNDIKGGFELFKIAVKSYLTDCQKYVWTYEDDHPIKKAYSMIYQYCEIANIRLSDQVLVDQFILMWQNGCSDSFHNKNMTVKYFVNNFNKLTKKQTIEKSKKGTTRTEPSKDWTRGKK